MKKIQWMTSQEYTVIRIDVPRMNEKSPMAAEQMFATIHGIYSESAKFQYHLSFEIISKEKFIQFFVYLPVHLKDFVEGQVYAQYPNVEIHEVEDYTVRPDVESKNFAITELALTKPDVYPIKQFTDFEVDPISAITSVMSQLSAGEEIWFQMIIRPKGDRWQEKGHTRVNSVRSGGKPTAKLGFANLLLKEFTNVGKGLLSQAVNPGYSEKDDKKDIKLQASVEEALKGIEQKITKLGFETKIRIVALGTDPTSAKLKCRNVCAAFKQFNTTNLNGFRVGEIKSNDHTLWQDYVGRSFEDDGNIFNIAELASLFHFPSSTVSTPNIVWSGSKKGEPPANLPIRSNIPPEDFTVIGMTNFRNVFTEFGIKRDDRRRHIYLVGKSGVGKSVLIENMAINDVCKGSGVIVVDPHGELAEKVLSCIPDERVNDVIVFDPSDRDFPIAFNLLETVDDDFKGLVASGFIGIIKKLFDKSWGPRLEHILRNTVLALLDHPGATMLDIPRMLTNNRFRDNVLLNVKDPIIKEFWMNEFASFDNKFRTEAVSPILNKVGQFLSSSTIRNIVGQPKSRINIREIMDQEKILIVNLSRGKIGEDNSALLGAMMITKIQLAAMSRANVTVDKRPDCFLYVDEFQNFATEAFAVILSEARKYGLGLTMAHQYITQLPEELRDAIFGNAGTLISFRVGGADADVLVKEFEPVFTTNDLLNLEKFNIYIKLLVDGVAAPAFSAKTLPPVQRLTGNIQKVIEHSHATYSTRRVDVEEMISGRSTQEEHELKAEAEAFKKGGLEAILLKKHDRPAPTTHTPVSAPVVTPITTHAATNTANTSISAAAPLSQQIESKTVVNLAAAEPEVASGSNQSNADVTTADSEVGEIEKKKEPRVIRYDNILHGKIYKERTARGGVKWYLGEEIDKEKIEKSGTIIDDNGQKIIDLSRKVADQKTEKNPKSMHHDQKNKNGSLANDKHHSNDQNAEKKNDSSHLNKDIKQSPDTESKTEPDLVADNQKPDNSQNLPIIPESRALSTQQTSIISAEENVFISVPAVKESREVSAQQDKDLIVNNTHNIADHKHLEEGKPVNLSE